MNPLDALFVPPALVKRALDDLHDIARVVRRVAGMEDDILARVDVLEVEVRLLNVQLGGTLAAVQPLAGQIAHMEEQLDALAEEMAPIVHLGPVREGIETLSGQISHMEQQLDGLAEEMAPIQHVEAIRRGIEPLEQSMVSVRESVDELEPMVADLDQRIGKIQPAIEDMQDSVEPIGELAEKIPGNRRRRSR